MLEGREAQPIANIVDGRTIQSTPESAARAGYEGYKRQKDSKVHANLDTFGHLIAIKMTLANEQDRHQIPELWGKVQEATGENVQLVFDDQGYTGGEPKAGAKVHGIKALKMSSRATPSRSCGHHCNRLHP